MQERLDRAPETMRIRRQTAEHPFGTIKAWMGATLSDVYLPQHNACFAVAPSGEGSAFTPIPGVDLDEILCVQEERQVGNDNCVSFQRLKLQIPESPMRRHFVKARVEGPRLSRRLARPLPWAAMHRPLRRERKAHRKPTRRLSPLGGDGPCGHVDDAAPRPHAHRRTKAEEADT
jgi:hypothetical protein